MASLRLSLLTGVALMLPLAVPGTPEAAPLHLAQATTGADTMSAAEKAVEDARAALREAMAKGGDVRAARRDLHAALQALEQGDSTAPVREADDGDGATTAPADTFPTIAAPSADTIPTLPLPETDFAQAETPDAPSEPPPPAPTPQMDQPATQKPSTADDEPGFIRRLFGFGSGSDQDTPPATDRDTPPGEARDSGGAPDFADLPPPEGPKILNPTSADGEVVEEAADRIILRRAGRLVVVHDDNDRFRRKGEQISVTAGEDGATVTTVTREDGDEIITTRSRAGDIIERRRQRADGSVDILIGQRDADGAPVESESDTAADATDAPFDVGSALPALEVDLPAGQYVVEGANATRAEIETALTAEPVEAIERPYTLREIRQSARVRAKLRRIDLDTLAFAEGSADIGADEVGKLQALGGALAALVANDANEVFLIEAHNDAPGADVANLGLSDKRAERIAELLTYHFNIPPENLVTQGYGEEYLKIPTARAEARNVRASVLRITPLLAAPDS